MFIPLLPNPCHAWVPNISRLISSSLYFNRIYLWDQSLEENSSFYFQNVLLIDAARASRAQVASALADESLPARGNGPLVNLILNLLPDPIYEYTGMLRDYLTESFHQFTSMRFLVSQEWIFLCIWVVFWSFGPLLFSKTLPRKKHVFVISKCW